MRHTGSLLRGGRQTATTRGAGDERYRMGGSGGALRNEEVEVGQGVRAGDCDERRDLKVIGETDIGDNLKGGAERSKRHYEAKKRGGGGFKSPGEDKVKRVSCVAAGRTTHRPRGGGGGRRRKGN